MGSHLKRPLAPVYVVQSESHYSVLWSEGPAPDLTDLAAKAAAAEAEGGAAEEEGGGGGGEDEGGPDCVFDLMYYDQLAERDTAVRLTIRRRRAYARTRTAAEVMPPLENVVLTRWPDAEVDWNGEEIIL